MIKIEIKNRWTGLVIFEYTKENNTIKKTVEEAIKSKANLSFADLSFADLSKANLSKANLLFADLSKANLSKANLSKANLSFADLSKANLSKANLSEIKNDFFEILLKSKNEIHGLKEALIKGNINGSTYTGDCCCLVGTIGKIKGCGYEKIDGIKPNSSRPAERWFLGIKKGDTHLNSVLSEITLEWIDEFLFYLNK